MKNYKHVHRKGVLQRFVQTIALGMAIMMLYACAAPATLFAFEEADQYFYPARTYYRDMPMAESAREYYFCFEPLANREFRRNAYIYTRPKEGGARAMQ